MHCLSWQRPDKYSSLPAFLWSLIKTLLLLPETVVCFSQGVGLAEHYKLSLLLGSMLLALLDPQKVF